MKKISFLITIRNVARQRLTSIISIAGLSVGLAGVFILTLYIINELSFDSGIKNADSIYRINTISDVHHMTYARCPYVLGTTLKNDVPEGLRISRVFNLYQSNIKLDQDLVKEDAIYCAENDIFELFGIDVLLGNKEGFLKRPESLVISEEMAGKYFGQKSPLGESVIIENNGQLFRMVVDGVYRNLPSNSSFKPEFLIPIEIGLDQMDMMITSSSSEPLGADYFASSWSMYIFFTTYLILPETYTPEMFESLLGAYKGKHYDEELGLSFEMQKYSDLYFNSTHITAGLDGGDRKSVMIYAVVTFLLLLTTVINYILMSTSSIEKRRKEIGVKMINGASRVRVISDILTETLAFSLLATLIGISLTEILLPYVSQTLFGKDLIINYVDNWVFTIMVILILLLVGAMSGIYLATRLTTRKPYEFLKPYCGRNKRSFIFTAGLGIIQLSLSVGLLICTGTIFSQMKYFRNADIGFDIKNVVSIDVSDELVKQKYESLKSEISLHPGVKSVSGSMWAPPTRSNMSMSLSRVDKPNEEVNLEGLMVDYDIASTLGLRIVDGSDFSRDKGTGPGNVIINQKAIETLGIEGSPIGVELSFGTICGVVKDFHIHSFHKEVPPTLIHFMPPGVKTMLLRFEENSKQAVIDHIESVWVEMDFEKPIEYTYLCDALEELYSNEQRFVRILTIFSIITMFIALLGIFGMARLTAERNTKQIGIRKVLGSESQGLVWKFLNHYFVMIAVSVVIATPISTLLMLRWLENFEFHGKISPLVYLFAILITIVVVFVTVASQVYRSANANPVDSLRYE